MLYESALDLEGADAVAGGDYHVVGPADEIVVSVLVLVGLVAGVVPVSLEDASGGLLVAPILTEEPDGPLRFDAHGYLALISRRKLDTFFVDYGNLEAGRRLAHRAGDYGHAPVVADEKD